MLYSARVVLLLAAALAVRGGTRGDMRDARQLQWEDAPRGAAGQVWRRGSLCLCARVFLLDAAERLPWVPALPPPFTSGADSEGL